jgi:hypothetical protein
LTAITAGTGISVTSPTGPIPTVAIDATVTTLTGSQTLTNKTLTSPALTTPTISTATTNGDILYGTGSGALARLGIGSSAQVLTVASGIPSWATPSSGTQSFTKIATSSFSAVSTTTTTFDGIFTATYKKYLVIMSEMTCSSSSAVLYLQVRTAGVTGTTAYYGSSISVNSAGATRSELSSNASQWGIARQSDTLKSSYNFYFTTVGNASEKPSASCQGANQYDQGGQVFGGLRDSATTVDGFILSASTGNISGTATIFGIVN